jgi:hypothetical protein
LDTLELVGGRIDEAFVVHGIGHSTIEIVVDALRKPSTDSGLANRVFGDGTVGFSYSCQVEGAWCEASWDDCCRGGSEAQSKE